MKQFVLSLALLSLTSLGFAQKKIDYSKVPSLIQEAIEKGKVKLADSLTQDYANNYLLKLKKEELYSKDNLTFLGFSLRNENSKAFKLFMKEPEKINKVLGDGIAQGFLRTCINRAYLPKDDDYKKMNVAKWDSLEKIVVSKFGVLGKETVYGQKMMYYYVKEDWKNYGVWYQKYFEMRLKYIPFHINNFSWALFEHVNDPKVLLFACDIMKHAIEDPAYNDHQALDTYANLLYKTGQKEKAIEWEEKAVKLSNNDKVIVETLEKMKNNVATWPERAKN